MTLSVISEIEEGDFVKLVPLLTKMHAESALLLPPIDGEKTIRVLHGCVVFVSKLEGNINGLIALRQVEWWFSKESFIGDQIFYVDSERRGLAAQKLLNKAKEYATMCGLPLLMSTMDGVDVERKDAFYTRMHLKRVGGVFVQGL